MGKVQYKIIHIKPQCSVTDETRNYKLHVAASFFGFAFWPLEFILIYNWYLLGEKDPTFKLRMFCGGCAISDFSQGILKMFSLFF